MGFQIGVFIGRRLGLAYPSGPNPLALRQMLQLQMSLHLGQL